MPEIKRTTSTDSDFSSLVKMLDKELAVRDGDQHAFYSQYNKVDKINEVVVAYEHGQPIGCGAIKIYAEGVVEVKRMYVLPTARKRGVAAAILKALEQWSKELSYRSCVLETGKNQPEAIALYTKSGYNIIPNYGQYQGIENSVCFEKILIERD